MSCKTDDTTHTFPVLYRLFDFAHPLSEGSPDGVIVIPSETLNDTERFRGIVNGLRRRFGTQIYAELPSLDDTKLDDHLTSILRHALDGIVLSGCRGGMDVQHAGCLLAVHEALHNRHEGVTKIIAEAATTTASCFTLQSYAGSSPRLSALIHAPRQLARTLKIDLSALATLEPAEYLDPAPLTYARAQTVLAAAIAQVPAYIAMTWPAEDSEARADANSAWERWAHRAQREGFRGHVSVIPGNILKMD